MGGKIKGIIRHFPTLEIPEREDETGPPPPPPFLKKKRLFILLPRMQVSPLFMGV